jgi:hypothetical protein
LRKDGVAALQEKNVPLDYFDTPFRNGRLLTLQKNSSMMSQKTLSDDEQQLCQVS